MKNKFLTICLAVVVTGTFLTSCKKNNNAPATSLASSSQLSVGIKSANAIDTVSGSAIITWTSGTANVSEFKFEASKQGLQIEVTSHTLTNVDLFALNPSLIGITLDTGTYSEIELRAELQPSSSSTLPLVLKGSFMPTGGASIPVEFDFNDFAEIKARAQNVVVNGSTNLTTMIVMHLNKLFANVTAAELTAATLTSGTIVISSSSNSQIYNQIKDQLSSCGDDDGFHRHDRFGGGDDN
jgi:hypothetical protein